MTLLCCYHVGPWSPLIPLDTITEDKILSSVWRSLRPLWAEASPVKVASEPRSVAWWGTDLDSWMFCYGVVHHGDDLGWPSWQCDKGICEIFRVCKHMLGARMQARPLCWDQNVQKHDESDKKGLWSRKTAWYCMHEYIANIYMLVLLGREATYS